MESKDYDQHARGVAQSIGLSVKIARGVLQSCPPWSKPCDHAHGTRYTVTLTNTRGEHLAFPFWGSMHDRALGKTPTVYDVLSCVSSDASMPTDPDRVVEELGPMKPSQAVAAAEFARKLRGFFRRAELERLGEIQ
jgi:hypothetical protein